MIVAKKDISAVKKDVSAATEDMSAVKKDIPAATEDITIAPNDISFTAKDITVAIYNMSQRSRDMLLGRRNMFVGRGNMLVGSGNMSVAPSGTIGFIAEVPKTPNFIEIVTFYMKRGENRTGQRIGQASFPAGHWRGGQVYKKRQLAGWLLRQEQPTLALPFMAGFEMRTPKVPSGTKGPCGRPPHILPSLPGLLMVGRP